MSITELYRPLFDALSRGDAVRLDAHTAQQLRNLFGVELEPCDSQGYLKSWRYQKREREVIYPRYAGK